MEWTDADIKRAAKEGWKRTNGFVVRAFDAAGRCPFPHATDVVRFLRHKGKESEWHKKVYLSLPWTGIDDQMTLAEGWRLAFDSITTRNIAFFETDDAAREYVVAHAQAGDPLHVKALSTLAKRRLAYGDK